MTAKDFTGPWAEMLAEEYRAAKTDFGRQVLKDSRVTEEENAEGVERYRTCLSSRHVKLGPYAADGSHTVGWEGPNSNPGGEALNAIADECMLTSGYQDISMLFNQMRMNPENLDFSEIMVACLKKHEAVDPGYTITDFDREYPALEFTLTKKYAQQNPYTSDFIVWKCQDDPLGILTGIWDEGP